MRPIRAFTKLFRLGIIALMMILPACSSATVAPTPTLAPTSTHRPPVTRIAFQSGGSIYVINSDGTDLMQVVKQGGNPVWSSDGQFIAFIYYQVIFLVDINSNKLIRLTKIDSSGRPASSFAWSPDGKDIAIGTIDGGGTAELYLTSIKKTPDGFVGNTPTVFKNRMDVYGLSWSADGQYLAFDYRTELHDATRIGVIESHTGKLTELVSNAWNAVWSPNGKQIVYTGGEPGKGDIYLISDVGEAIRVYHRDYPHLTNNMAGDGAPTWSPDGKKIAFTTNRDGNWEIYVMNADGSNQTRLTNNPADDMQPAWSPDGKQIAFVSTRDGNQEIYVMNVDGSHLLRLTNNDIDDWGPVWQPQPKP